jgi:DNA-binding MarR family transcriptional regulator
MPSVQKSHVTEIVERYHNMINSVRHVLAAEKKGLTAEHAVLLYLLGNEPMRVGDITRLWPSSVDYHLRELETLGMISRSSYRGDRRVTLVNVTSEGRAVQKIIAEMEKVL